ncbi:MAG TPA: MarR family transcriptional regulator [Acidimicrobiales bacterium]
MSSATDRVPAGQASLGGELASAVAQLRRVVRRAVRRTIDAPLSPAASEVLLAVALRPGVGVNEVAEELRLAPNTVSTLVRQLVDRGVLVRSTDPADRRVARLDVTPAARARIDLHRARRAETMDRALAKLDDREREVLAAAVPLLRRIAADLEAETGEG